MDQKRSLLISAEETQRELGLSRGKIYELLYTPGFPAFRIGRRILVSRSGLEEWITKQAGEGNGWAKR